MKDSTATVLVTDDDRTIRRNLVGLLRSEGYQTLEAADGDEALASIKANDPDAVLLDLKMPGRDGLEVLAELGPALAELPVEDLYYRLNVARIVIPPLRDRPEDIPPLAEYILRRVERRHGWGELSLSPESLLAVRERPWPGNVRQLENALARAAIAARGRAILPEHLDAEEPTDPAIPVAGDSAESLPLRALLAVVERRVIQRTLLACGGNRTRTAERLGISRRQLFDKIREYDLRP